MTPPKFFLHPSDEVASFLGFPFPDNSEAVENTPTWLGQIET